MSGLTVDYLPRELLESVRNIGILRACLPSTSGRATPMGGKRFSRASRREVDHTTQRSLTRVSMPELSTIYDYMRANAGLLGTRILGQFPALQQVDDPVSPRLEGLLRRPFPAQTIAIMGLAKRWRQARTGMVVAECGTGKTLISLGAIHVHSEGKPFTAFAMVPPHLVEKWAREGVDDRVR
jgi:hypothetical protein